jgi:hypothetical protein
VGRHNGGDTLEYTRVYSFVWVGLFTVRSKGRGPSGGSKAWRARSVCVFPTRLPSSLAEDVEDSDSQDEAPLSSRKRPRHAVSITPGKKRKPVPPKIQPALRLQKKCKQTPSTWSTCGCGLTDQNSSRHRTHARHLTWLTISTT